MDAFFSMESYNYEMIESAGLRLVAKDLIISVFSTQLFTVHESFLI